MKKRILVVSLVIALLAVCFAGTYAYLMDTHAQVNTFTTGNVYIKLDEVVAVKDTTTGNLIASNERTEAAQQYTGEKKLFPAMTVAKDPTITVEGTESAWIAAKVIISGAALHDEDMIPMANDASNSLININDVVKGGLLKETTTWGTFNNLTVAQNDNYAVYQVANGNNTWTLYIFMKAARNPGDTIKLFESLEIPSKWDNAQMDKIENLSIEVQAYAVQTNGFSDCFTAMTTAFKDAFKFN